MSITAIAQASAEQKFRQDIQSRREAQRTIYFSEYMAPVAEAFMSLLKNQLAPLRVVDSVLYYRPNQRQVGIDVNGKMHFGIAYDISKGTLYLTHYNWAWRHSEYPTGASFEIAMEWQDWDEERFIALLQKAWDFVDTHYTDERIRDTTNWWADNGFELEGLGL